MISPMNSKPLTVIAQFKTKPGQEIPVDAITILKAEETN